MTDKPGTRVVYSKSFACRMLVGMGITCLPALAFAQAAAPPGDAPAAAATETAAPAAPAMPPPAPPPAPMVTPPPAPAAAAAADAKFVKSVGGHIGIATPFVDISKHTTNISDDTRILTPIGIGIRVCPDLVIDFETVVANHVHVKNGTGPGPGTEFVVDPGVVYTGLPVNLGLRVASQIGHPKNIGFIPLINLGIVDFGGGTWFIEAAFPTFFEKGSDPVLHVVLHTGIGF